MGPLLFVYKGFLVIYLVYKKKIMSKIFFPKSLFLKKYSTERKFEKCCGTKKMQKGYVSGHKKFPPENT